MTQRLVYFIKPVGMDGPVKIGCSGNPRKRLSSLMSWSPFRLEIAATFPGEYDLEENLHQCFSDLHSHGEWFRPDPRLTETIKKLQAGMQIFAAVDLSAKLGRIHNKAKKGRAA